MNYESRMIVTTHYIRDIMFVSLLEIVPLHVNYMTSHVLLPCSLLCHSSDLTVCYFPNTAQSIRRH